uniref:Peptidase A2 domain-containing protein n=1 Tax=Haemonchus contortus TaxID=6289 RepID=A0A7I4YMT3_HAECO
MLALIDTGAGITVASQSLLALLGIFDLETADVPSALGMAGIPVRFVGSAVVNLQIGNEELKQKVHFTEGQCVPTQVNSYDLILGNDVLCRLPPWSVDYENRLVHIGPDSVQIFVCSPPLEPPRETVVWAVVTTVLPPETETVVPHYVAEDSRSSSCLWTSSNVLGKDNLFVTPAAAVQRVLGIVMSKVVRFDTVKGLRIAFEGAPEAVSFSPSIYEFRVSDADLDEIVTAISRSNVSCAMRFSELPASKEAQRTLCALVRSFLPAHPEEGLLPLRVFKLTRSEREWISDRAGNFDNYRAHPRSAQQYMAQLFNAACSALAAVNHMNDDKRTHMLDAVIPDIEALPFRFDFTLADMSSECGWTNQRPVYLWIVGSRSLLRTITQQAVQSFEDRSIAVRLVVPAWAHRYAVRATARRARTRDNVTKVQVCVRLAPPPFGAEPVYELISQSRLFGEFPENSQATAVPNAIYGQQRIEVGPDGPQHENVSVSVGGRSFTLREDQVAAPKMSERRLPILAIQAAFGTGKTVVGALIAARTFSKFQKRVIATTSTNTAVAQFTDTLLRLDEYRNIHILRYVSDSALMEGAPQTPIDLHTILKRLPVDYADKLFEEALQTCRKYKRGIT